MNDFTKEELEWLYHEVTVIKNNYRHTHTISIPIQSKIQSMIDNYCDNNKCVNPNCNLSSHPANVDCIKLEINNDGQ